MQADDQMDKKIYNKIWRDYCLSDWFITDLMSCRNGGSYIEALNALIYNRQLVVKNTPVNTLSEGNQVSTLRQLVVKNENRDLNGFEYRKCIKMEIRVTNRIRCVWSTIFH